MVFSFQASLQQISIQIEAEMNCTDLECSLVAMPTLTAVKCKVEEPLFFFFPNCIIIVSFWIFRAFVIISRELERQYCTSFLTTIFWDHSSLRTMLVLGKFCHWLDWQKEVLASGKGKVIMIWLYHQYQNQNSTVKLKSLHNKNSVHYMNTFKHARVHIDPVKVM